MLSFTHEWLLIINSIQKLKFWLESFNKKKKLEGTSYFHVSSPVDIRGRIELKLIKIHSAVEHFEIEKGEGKMWVCVCAEK